MGYEEAAVVCCFSASSTRLSSWQSEPLQHLQMRKSERPGSFHSKRTFQPLLHERDFDGCSECGREVMNVLWDISLASRNLWDEICTHTHTHTHTHTPHTSWLQSRAHTKTAYLKAETLPTKSCAVKAVIFPVVMYGCKSWTIKKAEHWTADAFTLWSWRRLLRVPWTTRRSNQSILKEINPEYSLEGPVLKLQLQSFGYLIWRADSLEKTLVVGKTEGRRRRGWQGMRCWIASPTLWTWVWVNSGGQWRTGKPDVIQSMGSQRVQHDLAAAQPQGPESLQKPWGETSWLFHL